MSFVSIPVFSLLLYRTTSAPSAFQITKQQRCWRWANFPRIREDLIVFLFFFVDFRRNDKTIGEQFYSEEKTCDIIIKQLPMHKSTGERRRWPTNQQVGVFDKNLLLYSLIGSFIFWFLACFWFTMTRMKPLLMTFRSSFRQVTGWWP